MADGFIVRKGGVTTEQALAPTITEVSTTQTSITFTITNNDASTAVILYEVGDTTPDANSIELASEATSSNLTISGLSLGLNTLYATANVTGKVKSNVTEREFTLISPFTVATGGTTLEYNSSGKRFRSHTFTSDGTFTVTNVGEVTDDRNQVDYLIIAGGGAGGNGQDVGGLRAGGGGGAGGYRTTNGTSGAGSSARTKVTVTAQGFSIVVGAGGTVADTDNVAGNSGSASSGLGISTVGGGGGAQSNTTGISGGSGSGAGAIVAAGSGGTGTADEGRNGGSSVSGDGGNCGAGGGGANSVGGNTAFDGIAGNGGAGLSNTLRTGSSETRAGGGGGATNGPSNIRGIGGTGGGGNGASRVSNVASTTGTANTGSGGGGGSHGSGIRASNGGKGIVVIRYEIATV